MSESGCGHAVVTGIHLCMWVQYSVVYGKPALNEDNCSLKRGVNLIVIIDENKSEVLVMTHGGLGLCRLPLLRRSCSIVPWPLLSRLLPVQLFAVFYSSVAYLCYIPVAPLTSWVLLQCGLLTTHLSMTVHLAPYSSCQLVGVRPSLPPIQRKKKGRYRGGTSTIMMVYSNSSISYLSLN